MKVSSTRFLIKFRKEKQMTYPQLNLEAYDGTTAIIHTNHGDMTVKLFDELAPKTVKNFVEHSKKGVKKRYSLP